MNRRLIIIDDYSSSSINGIGTYVSQLVLIYQSIGYDVFAVAYNYPVQTVCFKEYKGVTTLCIPILKMEWCEYFTMCCHFLRLNVSDSSRNLFVFNYSISVHLLEAMKRYFVHSKFVYTIHDMSWTEVFMGNKGGFLQWYHSIAMNEPTGSALLCSMDREKRMLDLSDKVITLTETTFRLIKDIYRINPQKVSIIPNGITDTYMPCSKSEQAVLRSQFSLQQDEFIILYVGRIHPSKGIIPLLKAFDNISKLHKKTRLVMVGAQLKIFPEFMEHVKGKANVMCTGFVDKIQLRKWYQIANLAVLPSFYEQCSFAGIEYMMQHIPTVSSDGFCLGEMFVPFRNSLVANIEDHNDLCGFVTNLEKSIVQMMDNQDLATELADRGRLVFHQKYEIQNVIAWYEQLESDL